MIGFFVVQHNVQSPQLSLLSTCTRQVIALAVELCSVLADKVSEGRELNRTANLSKPMLSLRSRKACPIFLDGLLVLVEP